MNRSQLIWTAIFAAAGIYLLIRVSTGAMGQEYVKEEVKKGKDSDITWTEYKSVDPQFRDQDDVSLSWPRTIGLWVAALLTLCVFSFLYGDNPFYRLAEAIFVGVSAAYLMVVAFWAAIVQNLIGKLRPEFVRDTVAPGLAQTEQQLIYIVPLVLSVLMLMRLSPQGSWISRWPIAFFIGATAGIRMVGYFESDFVRQIQNTIMPLAVITDGEFLFWKSIKNLTIFIGVMAALVYFFFSVEHTGIPGKVSRLGIWFLMIAFGASFGYTVMGRIALLAQRMEFLLDDWLWLIDPLGRREGL